MTIQVSLQLDDDKLVSVGRSGKLRVSRLRLESSVHAYGHPVDYPVERGDSSRAVLEDCTDLAPGDPTDLMRCYPYP